MPEPYGPWDDYRAPPGGIVTHPADPTMPYKAPAAEANLTGQNLQNQRLPVQTQGDILGNVNTAQQPIYNRDQAINRWTDNIRNDKRINTYEQALPVWADAIHARGGIADDNYLVNAMAKIADPSTGVNTRESDAMEQGQPAWQQFKAQLGKQFGADAAGNFTEEARKKMRATVTGRMKMIAEMYNGARDEWRARLKQTSIPGMDPETILGPHAGKRFQKYEADYKEIIGAKDPRVHNLDNSIGAVPSSWNLKDLPGSQEGIFTPGGRPGLASNKPGPLEVAVHGRDRLPGESDEAYVKRTEALDAQDAKLLRDSQLKGVRSPQADKASPMERIDAYMRGVADIPTFGMADKLAAAGDTIFSGGTMKDNLAKQYAISDYDAANHPYSRFTGQMAGGAILPMGDMSSIPQIALKSGALGGAYGLGSSRSMADVPGNVAVGTGAGLGVGAGIGALGKGVSSLLGPKTSAIPPLVDPITGRLNQPLEHVTPAQRMAAGNEFGVNLPLDAAGDRTAALLGKGLDIAPFSAGVMQDSRRGLAGEVDHAVSDVAGLYGPGRNQRDAGAALQRGANDWMGRFDATTKKVYDAIPISPKSPTSLDNTRATLGQLTSAFESNPELAATLKSAKLEQYASALQGKGLSWEDLKAFRSRIGYEIGEQRFSDSPTKDQLRALYGSLSEDMRQTAAAKGPRALRAFDRANTFYAQGQERIDKALVSILGDNAKQSPEAAAQAVQKIMMSGKGSANIQQLGQIRKSLVKGGEWNEVASSLINLMGQPLKSEGREFNPQTFVQNYADMSEDARKLLFADRGRGDLRGALDRFVAVNQRLAGTNALRNTSNTAPGLLAGGMVSMAGAALINPILAVKLAAGAVGNFALGKLWTNQAFVNWATGYSKLVASGAKPAAMRGQMGRLSQLAIKNPALRGEIGSFAQSLMRAANDNAGQVSRAAAAGNNEEDQQNQYRQ